MNKGDIKAGCTYRTPCGDDYFVLAVAMGDLDYRVESGPQRGIVGHASAHEFASRVKVCVPNHPAQPLPARALSSEES